MYNLLHLQQFVWIVRYGGFGPGALHMSHDITPHTLRQNLTAFEHEVGVKLLERGSAAHPTAAGARLYAQARDFLESLDAMIETLPGRKGPAVRAAVSEYILREYVPELLGELKRDYPDLRVSFRSGPTADIQAMMRAGEIDVGFTLVERVPTGLEWQPLLKVRIGLLSLKTARSPSVESLLRPQVIREPLVSPVERSAVARLFQGELRKHGCVWLPTCEVNSTSMVRDYVLSGQGIGVCVNVPPLIKHARLKFEPLEGFPELTVAALWRTNTGPLPALIRTLLPKIIGHADWAA